MQYRFFGGRRQVVEPYLTVPESSDPAECLPATLRKRDDDARYLPSVIHHHQMIGKVDGRGWVPLKASYLEEVMAKDDCSKVVQALLSAGVIERDYYIVGKKSFSYRLGSRFENDRFVKRPIECKRLRRGMLKLAEKRLEIERSRMLPVHEYLLDMQASLTIDRESAMQLLPSFNDKFGCQAMLVDRLCEGVHSFSVGRFGRVSSSICNLKREFRVALRIQNQPLACLDLKNSQPALLGKLLREHKRDNRQGTGTSNAIYDPEKRVSKIELDKNEVARFVELVQSGTFYDVESADMGISRQAYKDRFMPDVLAKAKANDAGAEYPSAVEDHFGSRYPTIYRFIRAYNDEGRDHAQLIRALQRQESGLVIEGIAEILRQHYPDLKFQTVYDAIFCPVDRVGDVQEAFNVAFKQNDYQMSVDVTTDLRAAYLDNPRNRTKRRRRKRTRRVAA